MQNTHKQAINDRLESALKNLYHNATPQYFSVADDLQADFQKWFYDVATWEIEYINDNLGCTKREYDQQKKLGFTDNERYYYLVRSITNYGKLYTYGRGGRTLAPDKLMTNAYNPSIKKDYFEESSIADKVEAIEIIEAFNQYVKNWNSKTNLQAMWKDYCSEQASNYKEEAKGYRLQAQALIKELKTITLPSAICDTVKRNLKEIKAQHKAMVYRFTMYQAEAF